MMQGEPIGYLRCGTAVDASWAHLIDSREDWAEAEDYTGTHAHGLQYGPCAIIGCGARIYIHGLCSAHYHRSLRQRKRGMRVTRESIRRGMRSGPKSKRKIAPCSLGCGRPYYAAGLCRIHYERARREKKRNG